MIIAKSVVPVPRPCLVYVTPDWAEEQARVLARDKGWDYYVLRSNWMGFAKAEMAKGNPPKSAGAAFVAYCKKQESLR